MKAYHRREYVAAHRRSAEIIGPGITRAIGTWRNFGTNTRYRLRAPRLDFHFYRVDGTVCRVHPGARAKEDAQLVFEDSCTTREVYNDAVFESQRNDGAV